MVKKGLRFISNRQRRKEGTFCASELAGIEPTPAHYRRVGYACLNLSATAVSNAVYSNMKMRKQGQKLESFQNIKEFSM